MNVAKLDAALAAAVEGVDEPEARRLSVFVHLEADAGDAERDELAALGIVVPARGSVCTATLSAGQVADLSEHPWVRRLALSQPMELLGEDQRHRPPTAPR